MGIPFFLSERIIRKGKPCQGFLQGLGMIPKEEKGGEGKRNFGEVPFG
jgi:hypothetical protein